MSRSRTTATQARLAGPLLALGLVLALGVAALVWADSSTDEDPASVATVREDGGGAENALARRVEGDPMALGEVDAPVVMVMWSDFQCPFCGRFTRETEPELIDRYVNDGTLRLEWRDFPYLGEQSQLAARAGRAAGAQNAFWEFQAAVYDLELPPNSGELTEDRLTGIAEDLGLDGERFRQDMAAPALAEAVAADFAEGQSIGITGTPAFLVGDTPIMGAQPIETFTAAIEAAAEGR